MSKPAALHPRSWLRRAAPTALTLALALSVGAGIYWFERDPQPQRSATLPLPTTEPAQPPIARIINDARALKLVTWQFETTISAESVSDKWYGSAVASVRAPVRYQYGVDLEGLRREDVLFSEDGAYTFIVPRPQRIAVEVDVEKLEQNLRVSGARWKSQNQGQLDNARAKLKAVAQQTVLSGDDEKRLRDVSREQVERLLRNVIGSEAAMRVNVRFAD